MTKPITELVLRRILAEQRQAITQKIEDAALHVLATADENGAPIIAETLRQAAEIARWTVYDPSVLLAEDGAA